MSEDRTLHLASFQEKVLAELETISSRLAALEKRVGDIDFERLHKEFIELHTDMKVSFGNFDRKLDVVNSEMLQLKADQKGIEKRVDKLEIQIHPQVIVQEQEF